MKNIYSKMTFLGALALALYGCGGGSGGTVAVAPPTAVTTLSGVASNAPISGAAVTAYQITAGAKGALLGFGTTDTTGAYHLNLGSYVGPVLVEVSGGSYTDEATGNPNATVPAGQPLHVAVANASGTLSAAVTPLTELAYQMTASNLAPSSIAGANAQVAVLFKLSDIVATQPVAPTTAALGLPSTSQDQRDYTLALATVSQIAATQGKSVADTVTLLKSGIGSGGSSFTPAAVAIIQSAAQAFFQPALANVQNTTGVSTPAATKIAGIGARTATVKLSVLGTWLPVSGVQAILHLPAGVTVNADSTGLVAASALVASDSASLGNYLLMGYYLPQPGTVSLAVGNTQNLSPVQFATLTCNVAYDAPSPSDFSYSGLIVYQGINSPAVDPLLVSLKLDVTIQ